MLVVTIPDRSYTPVPDFHDRQARLTAAGHTQFWLILLFLAGNPARRHIGSLGVKPNFKPILPDPAANPEPPIGVSVHFKWSNAQISGIHERCPTA
ncbi:MAG: hypothetical protein CMM01_04565 [Rhodopirellula sp.]|nr:hypothetical protein [Rhodopirellula sp.]